MLECHACATAARQAKQQLPCTAGAHRNLRVQVKACFGTSIRTCDAVVHAQRLGGQGPLTRKLVVSRQIAITVVAGCDEDPLRCVRCALQACARPPPDPKARPHLARVPTIYDHCVVRRRTTLPLPFVVSSVA